ncbi:hypothetical protein [Chitinophaga sp. LS1]|uniref:hypothetical protein n=1 Tax=Chitinophaga sp. LS1 TaxID=3051176 RepID=UPI002AABDBA1|nr:hypothetical protein [Chitinophaga sp. LS1]WPV68100.1 hypothetical protein QQL36_05100 [Chitinophaga sp. LS1]
MNDVKLGGSLAIPLPGISPGAGIKFHVDSGNSTFKWTGDLSELENVLKDAVPISPDQIHELVRQATTLHAGLIDMKKTIDAVEKKKVQPTPANNASAPSRGRSTRPDTPEKANNSSRQNNNQHKKKEVIIPEDNRMIFCLIFQLNNQKNGCKIFSN